jgi:hypothetical protein
MAYSARHYREIAKQIATLLVADPHLTTDDIRIKLHRRFDTVHPLMSEARVLAAKLAGASPKGAAR